MRLRIPFLWELQCIGDGGTLRIQKHLQLFTGFPAIHRTAAGGLSEPLRKNKSQISHVFQVIQRLRRILILRLLAAAVVDRKQDSGQSAADMGHVSHTAGPRFRHRRSDNLQEHPDDERPPGRHRQPVAAGQDCDHETPGPQHQRQSHFGEADGIEGDHSGDETAGPDAGNLRTGIENPVQDRGAQPRGDQQGNVFEAPEFILDVVAENHQEIEIPDQVENPDVQEHRRENGQPALARPLRRNESPVVDHLLKIAERQGEDDQTHGGDAPGDDRLAATLRGVQLHRHAEQADKVFPAFIRSAVV